MSFFTKPVGKRTRSQRLLYSQECVKNASKAHGSATTTHMDLVTSSDDSQNSHISSKDSDEVKFISIKSQEYANEAHGLAMGTHTYVISPSDDLDEDAVDILDHDTTSNQFPRSDEKEKVCPRSVKMKGGSQCENIVSQSEAGESQRQAGVGVSVTQTNGHEVKLNNIKSEKYANKAHGSAMGKHTYFISTSDDSDEDAVELKSGSQCEGGGKQSQPIASQSQAGAGQRQAGVKTSSSTTWTKQRIAQAKGLVYHKRGKQGV